MTPLRSCRPAVPLVLLLSLVLSGCSPTTRDEAAQPAAPAAAVTPPKPTTPAAVERTNAMKPDTFLTPGMAYGDARAALLKNGFQPVVDADCRANVVGAAWKESCAKNPQLCEPCEKMPELSAYSGDGNLLAVFKSPEGTLVRVKAYGMLSDWGVLGSTSRIQYSGWEPMQEVPAH